MVFDSQNFRQTSTIMLYKLDHFSAKYRTFKLLEIHILLLISFYQILKPCYKNQKM